MTFIEILKKDLLVVLFQKGTLENTEPRRTVTEVFKIAPLFWLKTMSRVRMILETSKRRRGTVQRRIRTSPYLNISCMLMPSVLRTVSFSPDLDVVSLSRQRVRPLVSMTTAFWATVDTMAVRSKWTLFTGNARSTCEKKKGWWG